MNIDINHKGCITGITETGIPNWPHIAFRNDEFCGPTWTYEGNSVTMQPNSGEHSFSGQERNLNFDLTYTNKPDSLCIQASVKNSGFQSLENVKAGIRLGINTYMAQYPDWNDILFPTMLRCEKTHFWGYFMGPKGQIMVLTTREPIAAYQIHYKPGLHRIYTAELNLLNPLPLPPRHPEGLDVLEAGEEKNWTITFCPVADLGQVKPVAARETDAPMIDLDMYTISEGETFNGLVYCGNSLLSELLVVHDADGSETVVPFEKNADSSYCFSYQPSGAPGICRLMAVSENGKRSEAILAVRHPWQWYLNEARRNAVIQEQKASTHTESWYGLFSGYLARKHAPDPELDEQIDSKFREIVPLMYDMPEMQPKVSEKRIQNHALMLSVFVDRYQVTGDLQDLTGAVALADLLLDAQTPDGAYRAGNTHYTSVVYIAKSIMELLFVERDLAASDYVWKAHYKRHHASVKLAINELTRNLDNIDTEGELTYEDGMIACSYTQIAMFALYFAEPADRERYLDAALYLKDGHRCLSQILIPDCRMNGGSLRFWESQYDILTKPNMMNSPHGWSAWRIYGLWYLYQLTGEEDYLRQTFNALGSCCQLIDFDSAELRWAFVADPYIKAKVWKEDPEAPGKGISREAVIGEQYMDMISQWYKAPKDTCVTGYWGEQDGGCCDNDVHEIFKCLEETVLNSAYVIERSGGDIAAYNCTVSCKDDTLTVSTSEMSVRDVHFNVRSNKHGVIVFTDTAPLHVPIDVGMHWARS